MGRWRIASRVDHPDLAEANALALADLDGGADTLVLVSAGAPTAYGFGVSLAEPGAVETVLAGVSLDLIGVRLDLGRDGTAIVDRLMAHIGHVGYPPATLDLGLDPVSCLAHDGILPGDWPAVAHDLPRRIGELDTRGFVGPKLRADGRTWHAAGATDAQELAAVVAAAVLYLRALEAGGIGLHQARSSVSFGLVADRDLVATLAKVRALPRLWSSVEVACGLEPRAIHVHADTAWRSMTAVSSHTNIVRSAAATAAAALAGADGVTVLPHTQPLGLPDADARRIARNTQHVLAEESQLWRVADPAAGADVVEAATRGLCDKAWAEVQTIEREGGLVTSLIDGRIQQRVEAERQARHDRLVGGEEILVGVTRYADEADTTPVVLPVESRAVLPPGDRLADPMPMARSSATFEATRASR